MSTISLNITGSIATITLNRPDKLNAFTREMHADLREALSAVEADKNLRCLVLTGAGRGFCAGQDLADLDFSPAGKEELSNTIEKNYNPLILRLQALPMPIVCAVNGIAAGAGANLALACDIVIAAESAAFLQAFSKIGLLPDSGGTWFLPQRVGVARAVALGMLAEKISASQAAQWGMIWQAVPDAELANTTQKLAEKLAAMPTRALVAVRLAMRAQATQTLEQQLNLENQLQGQLGQSKDYLEGVNAFLQKRAPVFTGK